MEPTKKKEETQEERVKRLAEEQLGPYRENAKPKELLKFWVNICYTHKDKREHNSAGWQKGKDRLDAVEKFLEKKKIEQNQVWAQNAVGLEDFDDDNSE